MQSKLIKNLFIKKTSAIFLLFILIFQFLPISKAFASATDGTIDTTYKYAWGENTGWINFGTMEGNVHITNTAVTGYAWSDNYGWINLNPPGGYSGAGVINDGNGTLSGRAWSEQLGWIDFTGVTINTSGVFSGYATIDIDSSRISFNCSNGGGSCSSDFKVKTDWLPIGSQPVIVTPTHSGSNNGYVILTTIPEKIIETIPKIIEPLIPEFLKPKPKPQQSPLPPVENVVPKSAPLAFKGKWDLVSYTNSNLALQKFVSAPLPKEIRALAQKFPRLENTFNSVGISRLLDLQKLVNTELSLPGLTESSEPLANKLDLNKFAQIEGMPLAKLTPAQKKNIPSEIVFAQTANGLVDYDIALSLNDKGEAQQHIDTISGKPLSLSVKPDGAVKSVKGYVVLKSATRRNSPQISFNSLMASAISAMPVLSKAAEPINIENKLVLSEFEYTDPDHDGIYTAEIKAPVVDGEYEIITVLEFSDPDKGRKEIRLVAVVDPEGYVYEKSGDKETRIPNATVSIYKMNPKTKEYELWPAADYQQENPQITDVRGVYSFLVPEGEYYIKTEASGYLPHDTKPFTVQNDRGVHFNIELKAQYWWLKMFNFNTVLLLIIAILLLINFYRGKIKERFTTSL